MSLPQGEERWVVVYTQSSVERVRQTMQRQVSKVQAKWQQICWHFSKRHFACEADARAALERELKGKPSWLEVTSSFIAHPHYEGKGRPPKEGQPGSYQWQVELQL